MTRAIRAALQAADQEFGGWLDETEKILGVALEQIEIDWFTLFYGYCLGAGEAVKLIEAEIRLEGENG